MTIQNDFGKHEEENKESEFEKRDSKWIFFFKKKRAKKDESVTLSILKSGRKIVLKSNKKGEFKYKIKWRWGSSLFRQPKIVILYKVACSIINEANPSFPSFMECLLKKFVNVFTKYNSSNLLLMQGIEHVVDLVLEASIQNLPTNRSHPKKMKAMQRPIEKILAKTHVMANIIYVH